MAATGNAEKEKLAKDRPAGVKLNRARLFSGCSAGTFPSA